MPARSSGAPARPPRHATRYVLGVLATVIAGGNRLSAQVPLDAAIGLTRDIRVAGLVADVSAARVREIDSTLVAFGTRHTMSDTVSQTRGIGAARRWIHGRLKTLARECGGCLRVEFDTATVVVARDARSPAVRIVNVLAWLPGRDSTRVVVFGGHYDSCVCTADRFDATSDAPGADDDGSGSAAVIEVARVFSRRYPRGLEATILFALYAGEEQGLFGSTHLAGRLHAAGYRVVAGMTDDIVGNTVAEDGRVDATSVRIYAGGAEDAAVAKGAEADVTSSRELARYVWGAAAVYLPGFAVRPTWRLDRIQRGGDHVPFYRAGDPALRFTERLENYRHQHLATDRLADVSFDYVANVARVNVAAVGSLAAAPGAPDSVTARRDAASGGQRWALAWKAVPGAVAYEVVVRRTTAPTYERLYPVGPATTLMLPEQLDDAWASVRAVGPGGERSLATAAASFTFVAR